MKAEYRSDKKCIDVHLWQGDGIKVLTIDQARQLRDALDYALERYDTHINMIPTTTYHVTVTEDAKQWLMSEYGLTEEHFVTAETGGGDDATN